MIETLPLFRPLNSELITLLRSLSPEDWNKKTVAGNWTVKDVAAHLLDVSVRTIALYRDNHALVPEEKISSYRDLVNFLNRINAEWIKAFNRISPHVLTTWLEETHEDYIRCLEGLDPVSPARFSVAWAGDIVSPNWFHIAREFTEKWHHQQQIRHAAGREGILNKKYYHPVLETFMEALPHQFREIGAPIGTVIQITIDTDAGGSWCVEKAKENWQLTNDKSHADTLVEIPAGVSWKLFTKAVRYSEVKSLITVSGNQDLAIPVLNMLNVMA